MWEENPCTMLIRRLYLSLTRLSTVSCTNTI